MAMTTATPEREPVIAAPGEREQLANVERALEGSVSAGASLIGPDGAKTELPASLYQVLRQAVRELANGNGVSILPAAMELTTQRAADLLNVSRPYLIKLLEQGELPYRKVGTHRRIQLQDLLAYRAGRDQARRQILDELTRDAEGLGMYEEFYAAGRARVAAAEARSQR
jgi:excisionase family DNA binding protein